MPFDGFDYLVGHHKPLRLVRSSRGCLADVGWAPLTLASGVASPQAEAILPEREQTLYLKGCGWPLVELLKGQSAVRCNPGLLKGVGGHRSAIVLRRLPRQGNG